MRFVTFVSRLFLLFGGVAVALCGFGIPYPVWALLLPACGAYFTMRGLLLLAEALTPTAALPAAQRAHPANSRTRHK